MHTTAFKMWPKKEIQCLRLSNEEGTQTLMEGSKASQGTSGTQARHRPEVLLKPHTPFMLECFFSNLQAGLTAPVRSVTMNIHALFCVCFILFGHCFRSDQDFKNPSKISEWSRKFHGDNLACILRMIQTRCRTWVSLQKCFSEWLDTYTNTYFVAGGYFIKYQFEFDSTLHTCAWYYTKPCCHITTVTFRPRKYYCSYRNMTMCNNGVVKNTKLDYSFMYTVCPLRDIRVASAPAGYLYMK